MEFRTPSQFDIRPLPAIGVGAMPFSKAGAEHDAAAAVWHHAFDFGMTLINTADIYAPTGLDFGHNEKLVGEAVRTYPGGRDAVTVVTKNGICTDGNNWWRDNSPEYMMRAAEASNERLGFVPDAILVHRLNHEQSFEATIEGLLAVRDAGLALSIGCSNVTQAQFDIAWNISGGSIAFIENEQSPRYRADRSIIDSCTQRGVTYLAWSPLGGGDEAARLGELYPALAEVGAAHGASAQQTALAWLLAQGRAMTPIPAVRRPETAESSAASASLSLSPAEIAYLDVSPAGPGSVFPD